MCYLVTFVIVTDSASDTQLEITEREDVHVVSTFVIIGEIEYLDFEISNEELMEKFSQGQYSTTSQPSPEQFLQVYSKASEAKLPILGIHISSKLSGTFQGAKTVINDIEGADIELFDTYNVSFGSGYFVNMAVKLKEKGYSRDQVIEAFQKIRDRIHLEIVIDDIEYLKRGGRVNIGQYWLLKLLRLSPIVGNEDGKLERTSMTRGGRSGVDKIVKRIQQYEDYGSARSFTIGHINTPNILKMLKDKVNKLAHSTCNEIIASSTLLSHTGPEAFGIMVSPALESIINILET